MSVYFAHVETWKASKEREADQVYHKQSFDVCQKEWIQIGEVQFEVTNQHFAENGFGRAFKDLSDNILFQNKSWFLRKYHESSKRNFDELGTDVDRQTRKAIQMDCLSRHLAFVL